MPAEESTPAIVLRARDYLDSDRIVTILTAQAGKLGGIAKGAKSSRRRYANRLEPFSHVMLYFRRRPHGELVFITRAEAAGLPQFQMDNDLERFALGSYMLELTDALSSEEADAADAYVILCEALETLAGSTATRALRQAFELRLLRWAGFGLEFDRCRTCARPLSDGRPLFFITHRGGVVCERCRDAAPEASIRIAPSSADSLTRLARLPFASAASAEAAETDGAMALARFIAGVAARRLKSIEFLDSILGSARPPTE
ncbi:MAG TPA: DNA repair protein RecO [Candidatus Binataceae bacterium]|nr:DNA repair protein RecO [Candidatus Binataceae bacterium]